MFRRERQGTNPTFWLQVAGFILVLWAASSDALAQVREVVVTEVRGGVTRAGAPLSVLQSVRAGDRVRLSSDSQVVLFSSADAALYVVDGPAEVTVGARDVMANGKPVGARKLHDAYRNVKATSPELVQGTMVMRGAAPVRLIAPEGLVDASAVARFRWEGAQGSLRFELSTDTGDLVHAADAAGSELALPPHVRLVPGTRYVWALFPTQGGSAPMDWTEFAIGDAPQPGSGASERLLHAAWLAGHGMPRAASRSASPR